MTRAIEKTYHRLDPHEVAVDIDLTTFIWYDLYFALGRAPREGGWEGEGTVTNPSKTKVYWVDCDDLRAELDRRAALMEQRRQRQLKNAHTRELLKWRDYCYRFGGFYSPCDSGNDYGWNIEEIRAELAGREHIPNKKEARAKRQEAARQARKGKRG